MSDVTTIVPLWHPVPLLVLIAILGGFVLLRLQRASESRLRLVLFLAIALLPALNLLPLPRFSSQHYSFFALPAVGAMAAYYGLWLRARPAGHLVTLAAALLGLWILTAAATNLVASYRFRDDLTLFGPEVERDPRYLEGWYYIGLSLYDRGDIEPAAAALERALASDPRTIAYVDVQSAEINLALCRLEQNRLKEADDLLLSATGRGRSRDRAALIAFNRAVVAYRGGDTELARKRLAPLVEGTEGDLPDLFEAARRTLAGGAQAAPGTR